MIDKMRILIAYDGSDYANAAIEELRFAGLPAEAEVVVLTATDAWQLPEILDRVSSRTGDLLHPNTMAVQGRLAHAGAQAQKLASTAALRLGVMFPEWSVNAEARLGKPAWEIIGKSEEWHADLIVVGSKGRGAIERLLLGSVSQKVLDASRCSVRISRKRTRADGEADRVLVAVDGSANAGAVVSLVSKRQWPKGTEIRLIAVDDPFRHPPGGYVPWNTLENKPEENDKSREWIRKIIGQPTETLNAAGLSVSRAIEWGDAATMIIRESNEWKAGSIFMGARGLGRFKRFWIGSVSSTVAAGAACSVEVVRVNENDRTE